MPVGLLYFCVNSLWGLLSDSSLLPFSKAPWPVALLPQVEAGEAELAAGSSTGKGGRLMENPIWFNSGKLEGDKGGRKFCLACVQAADCIGLSLETHFPLWLLAGCHCGEEGLSFWCRSAWLRACFCFFFQFP